MPEKALTVWDPEGLSTLAIPPLLFMDYFFVVTSHFWTVQMMLGCHINKVVK